MLTFHPQKRVTVTDALCHPCMALLLLFVSLHPPTPPPPQPSPPTLRTPHVRPPHTTDLEDLHDEEDEDTSGVPLFDFDDTMFTCTADVKAAIYDETIAFHKSNPATAPTGKAPSKPGQLDSVDDAGRAAAGTLDKQDVAPDTQFQGQ